MNQSRLLFSNLVFTAFVLSLVGTPSSLFAKGSQPLDEPSEQALRQTQQLMTNPAERSKFLQSDSKASTADQSAHAALGDQTEGAYQISAQVLEAIAREAGGDPAKMQAISTELMANPNALEKYLTAAQREQIRGMASEIEKKNGAAKVNGAK